MKKIFILILAMTIEVGLCIFICLSFNDNIYDMWIEEKATIAQIYSTRASGGAVNNQSSHTNMVVKYMDKTKTIRLKNYDLDKNENDIITIKYNPENQNDIVFLPYEKYLISRKRRVTIIISIVLASLTLWLY